MEINTFNVSSADLEDGVPEPRVIIQTVPDNKYAVIVEEGTVLSKFDREDTIFNSILHIYIYESPYGG